MRSRGMVLAAFVSLLCAAGAVGCFFRSHQLRVDADWLMARGKAEAAEYARSFDGRVEEKQLATFEKRRDALEASHAWQVGQMLCVLASVAAAFASYVLFLFRRLREQLVEALPPEDTLPVAAFVARPPK